MIQSNMYFTNSHNMWLLYGAIDDLYQKLAHFSKLKKKFFSIHTCSIRFKYGNRKKVNCYWGYNNVHMQVLNVCFYSDQCSLCFVVSAIQRTTRGHASQHSKRLQRQHSRMNRLNSPIPATSRELGG